MTRNLIRETLTTLSLKNLASGAGDPFGGVVDMQGWNGCLFTAINTSQASTAVTSLTAYMSTTSTATSTSDGFTIVDSTGAIVSGPVTAGGSTSKGILQLDIVAPQERYLAPRLTRGTAMTHGGILAQRYGSPRMVSSTKASTDALATAVLFQPQSTG